MMQTVCLTTAYLGPVSYFTKLLAYDHIKIEANEYYTKQSYRNRCNIVEANGVMSLSVPIIKPQMPKCPTRDIRISDHGNWQHLHWNAIKSAYNSTPFFEYYQDDFAPFFEKRFPFLFDLNEQIRETVCQILNIEKNFQNTESYQKEYPSDIDDFREIIHPKATTEKQDLSFFPIPYYQVFSQRFGFIPDMSIIDLLFNMGPESIFILQKSSQKESL